MNRIIHAIAICVLITAFSAAAQERHAGADPALDTARIEQLTGAKGVLDATEGVFKVMMTRTDLRISVAGVHVTPPMGLTSWAAFKRMGGQDMVMGDLVLTEDQVNPVMDAALDNRLEITALHNHFLWDSPRVMFMHIGGMGDESSVATAVGKVFSKIRETIGEKSNPPVADIDPSNTALNPAKIEAVLHEKGTLAGGVYKVVVGRTTSMGDEQVGSAMGINTWAAFAGSDDKAVVDGDFAMLEGELQDILRTLRAEGINIVAIHNHMTAERPRIMFLHYWGIGRTEDLARGLRAALDRTASSGR